MTALQLSELFGMEYLAMREVIVQPLSAHFENLTTL